MSLQDKILNCSEKDVDTIMQQAIEEADSNSDKIERLGFLENGKTTHLFKGFIPLNARIKYSNLSIEDYGMQTTDYMYEFAHLIRNNNINTRGALIHYLENFINYYFGISGNVDREYIFNEIAWKTSKTDDEYFDALSNNKIGDLKHKGAAQCTERSAMAQQILSLFDTESYYCMGCLAVNKKQEAHCFNIVKRKNDYALLDYSCPVPLFNKDGSVKAYYPFVGTLNSEEFLDFINNGTIKEFDNYEIINNKKIPTNTKRSYVVGKFEIDNLSKDKNASKEI